MASPNSILCMDASVELDTKAIRDLLITNYSNLLLTPRYPRYSLESDRLASFQGWSVPYITSDDLSKNGFFYTGEGDKVVCFHCGVTVRNFRSSVDSEYFHLQYQPNCHFVRGNFFFGVNL
ncbi:putative inhibitor of apoptosis [Microplitis mediator]|uniref:putative inhibitor of apoptosis n=1 Tax=Microplitis mediator TaxID=375433 RepID=UPI00255539B7|nr:putative inhibitor of apoptosis [Microplitis mediator]